MIQRKIRRLTSVYMQFCEAASAAGEFQTKKLFGYYLFLRKKYSVSIDDFFRHRLFDNSISHNEYYSNNVKVVRSWKMAAPKYRPTECGKIRFFLYHMDYLVSKLLYPGLDAMDYLSYEFYNFRYNKRKTFVTEGYLNKMVHKLNDDGMEEIKILSDKARFNEYFSEFVHRRWIKSDQLTLEAFTRFCDGLDAVIVKPVEGFGGHGIYKASVRTKTDQEELYNKLKGEKGCIVEEIIRQHHSIAELNPCSVNTYRIYTCSDGKENITITCAVIRVGGGNGPTDNYHAGGYAAAVDSRTGIIVSRAINFAGVSVYVHPKTGKQILGTKLPAWNEAIDTVKKAHRLISKLGYVAWDVVACDDLSITLLEGNECGGVGTQQHPALIGVKPIYDQIIKMRKKNKPKA